MDRLSPEKRSWLMSRVKAKGTGPELAVRRMLHALGYRYRLHSLQLPGKPDLSFPSRRKVVFVHGCFWHGHEGCRYAKLPLSRVEFWRKKIEKNKQRDEKNFAEMKMLGWGVHVVWQCQLKSGEKVLEDLQRFLGPPGRENV